MALLGSLPTFLSRPGHSELVQGTSTSRHRDGLARAQRAELALEAMVKARGQAAEKRARA